MYVITNRPIFCDIHGIEFDLQQNSPTNEVYYLRLHNDELTEIKSQGLMDGLRYHKASRILFYIHGFNTMPDEAMRSAQALQDKLGDSTVVVPIIWACDGDFGVIKDYWDDQRTADMSGFSIARCFSKFLAWQCDNDTPCTKAMDVLAHSMGNRVLRASINAFSYYECKGNMPTLFDNIYMVAPDVRCNTLEDGKKGELLKDAADDVYVFYNKRDKALKASKVSNVRNGIYMRRLGAIGSNGLAHDINMTQQDMTDPLGHSYFLHDSVIDVVM